MDIQFADSSLRDDDSNAMILPGKKKKKDRRSEKVKTKKMPSISKSQKRKLEKIEEEKKNALLLSKSIELLEKYKIPESTYSLLQSSSKIGRTETVREKRQKAVQFSKAGLETLYQEPVPKSNRDIDDGNPQIESEPATCSFQQSHGMDIGEKDMEMRPTKLEATHMAEHSLSSGENKTHGDHVDRDNTEINSLSPVQVSISSASVCVDVDNSPDRLCAVDERESSRPKEEHESDMPTGIEINRTSTCSYPNQRGQPTAPIVVHVSRPKEVDEQRKDLPIVMMEQEIMEAISYHSAVIICGETGCGKTTQVPQFLYEAGFGSSICSLRSGMIGVTQPRRVAVLATAKRVSHELGLRLGKEVGFQVRYDKKIGESCSIKFMTDGILLREVQNDFLLKRYSILILDEAHERSLNTDILIGMLSRVVQLRQDLYEKQQKMLLAGHRVAPETMVSPLKLVLMSATLRVEDFISGKRLFQNPPPVLEVPTRQYPVTVHFSKRTEIVDYVGQAYKKVMSIHKRLPPGGILVFVTGQREVEFLCQKLRRASRELMKKNVTTNTGNELDGISEASTIEGVDAKEIDEVYQFGPEEAHQRSDRFSCYDEDECDADDNEDELDVSDSESESDWETLEDNGSQIDGDPLTGGNIADVLGEEVTLASLKAAFEALSGESSQNAENKETNPVIQGGFSEEENSTRGTKKGAENNDLPHPMHVLPLYAMLPAAAQLRVFEEVKRDERLVVVATNVAETSLTIPGIKYVVDTGREKVKNYNCSNGMETYEIQWISKASAAQRAGRAGRTGPGHCYRIYSSAVFNNIFPDFSLSEISKIPVDGVVLLMKSMGIDKVANFPFPTPPQASALHEAEHCLRALEALDNAGRLTPMGRAMAHYPMSPRHSRMLLTVIQNMRAVDGYSRANIVLGYATAAAAALSLPNPFVKQFEGSSADTDDLKQEGSDLVDGEKASEKEEKIRKKKLREMIKASRQKFNNPSSDVLTIAYALQCFEHSGCGSDFCSENALHLKTMEEMSKLRKQLLKLVFSYSKLWNTEDDFSWNHGMLDDVERAWQTSSEKHPLLLNEEEILAQAICAGWADRVAKRVRGTSELSNGERKAHAVRYQACMVKENVYLHRWSSLSNSAPEFLVYSELLQAKRPYMHGATSVKSGWFVKYAKSLCSFSAPLADPKPFYDPRADQVFSWVVPIFGPHLWELPLHSLPISDETHRVMVFAFALLEGQVLPCLKSVRKFMAAPPSTILRPEAAGQKRVGNLIFRLKTRKTDCCARLRDVWNENPRELHSEILDWFQDSFQGQFEKLWYEMSIEILSEPQERFHLATKRSKRKRKLLV